MTEYKTKFYGKSNSSAKQAVENLKGRLARYGYEWNEDFYEALKIETETETLVRAGIVEGEHFTYTASIDVIEDL